MKNKIDGVVVVEGKTDTEKLKSIFDVETIETNGSEISRETINLILAVAKTKKIYLFLDPDGPGEKIRKTINNELNSCINVFLKKEDMKKGSKKIGIAEAKTEAIVEAFKNAITFDKTINTITTEEFYDLTLDTKKKRQYLCDQLKISYCNQKTLYKRLNMMQLKANDIKEILRGYHE